jgi:adenylosuccinate synthase
MIDCLVGGQYGSEGKGKIAAFMTLNRMYHAVVRCGGPNAGHSWHYRGKYFKFRQNPCGVMDRLCQLWIAAGSYVDPTIVNQELREYGIDPHRLTIDPAAGLVDQSNIAGEGGMWNRIGSTQSGTGHATMMKIIRQGPLVGERKEELFAPHIQFANVSDKIYKYHSHKKNVLIEGTQGAALSLHHSGHYPYCTSRDTHAATFLGEAGVGPKDVDKIIMVIRTFPIRVGGNSGPLPSEISWEEVTRTSGYPTPLQEKTSVSKTIRRVAMFDYDQVIRAARINSATHFVLTGLDYLDYSNLGVRSYDKLTHHTKIFIENLQDTLPKVKPMGYSTGPDLEDMIWVA